MNVNKKGFKTIASIISRNVYMLLVLAMALTGCGTSSKSERDLKSKATMKNEFEKNDKIDEAVKKESSGQFSFGYLDVNKEVYEYDGKDVEIPFYFENMGSENEGTATIGLLVFVDGNVQNYKIKENGKMETMQKIVLKPKERKEFKIIFKPVSGKRGEKVGVIPATIWNPESIPEEKNPTWGNRQQFSAGIPLEIDMKCDGTNHLRATNKNVRVSDIPEEILDDNKNVHVSDEYDALDASVNFIMEPSNKDIDILYGKDGKVPITLKLYGGKNVNDKITVFINNNPVKIDKKDYIKVKTEKGKMVTITANLDLSQYDRINSIYAIVMTSGNDYRIQDIYKTESLLLINKGE